MISGRGRAVSCSASKRQTAEWPSKIYKARTRSRDKDPPLFARALLLALADLSGDPDTRIDAYAWQADPEADGHLEAAFTAAR
ncbi:MAG TPA: hypothetical protein ENI27_02060 [bacterium]|nr:hypothetical protein [bacterium]